jgi:hypothetical protein
VHQVISLLMRDYVPENGLSQGKSRGPISSAESSRYFK